MESLTNQKESIKEGQILFANIDCLRGLKIDRWESEYSDKKFDVITYGDYPYIKSEYIQNERDKIYIVIKYLGNGIFEEMTTGEKIRAGVNTFIMERQDGSKYSLKIPNVGAVTLELNYEDYLTEWPLSDSHNYKYEFLQKLEKIKEENIEIPILINDDFHCLEVNDVSKKLYLRHSDDERVFIISEIKKKALIDNAKVNEKISASIERANTDVTGDELNMAYLDNQLYDFEHSGKAK